MTARDEPSYRGRPLSHWLTALSSPEQKVRSDALEALREIGPEGAAAVPALIQALQDSDEFLSVLASYLLGRIGPVAVPSLIEALGHTHKDVRWGAANALGEMGPRASTAIPRLQQVLKDPAINVRIKAAEALWQIEQNAETVVPILLDVIRVRTNPDRQRHCEDVRNVLVKIGTPAYPALETAKDDPHPDVRSLVAAVLSGTPMPARESRGEARKEEPAEPPEPDEDGESDKQGIKVDWKWVGITLGIVLGLGIVFPKRPLYLGSINIEWLPVYVVTAVYFIVYYGAKALIGSRFGLLLLRVEVGALSPPLVTFQYRGVDCSLLAMPVVGELDFMDQDYDSEDAPPTWDQLSWWKKVVVRLSGLVGMFLVGLLILTLSHVVGRAEPKFLHEPARIGWVRPGSEMEKAGLQRGDEVVAAEYEGTKVPIHTWADLIQVLLRATGQALTLEARRGAETVTLHVPLTTAPLFDCADEMQPVLGGIAARSAAGAAGLRRGDRVTAVDEKPIAHWMEMRQKLQAIATEAKKTDRLPPDVVLTVERKKETMKITIPGNDIQQGVLGVYPLIPSETVWKGPGEASLAALGDVGFALRGLTRAVLKLGEFSPRYESVLNDTNYIEFAKIPATAGSSWNVMMVGLMGTIFLVFALVPLPPAPGYYIVLDGLESVRGRPLFSAAVGDWLDSWGWLLWSLPLVLWIFWF